MRQHHDMSKNGGAPNCGPPHSGVNLRGPSNPSLLVHSVYYRSLASPLPERGTGFDDVANPARLAAANNTASFFPSHLPKEEHRPLLHYANALALADPKTTPPLVSPPSTLATLLPDRFHHAAGCRLHSVPHEPPPSCAVLPDHHDDSLYRTAATYHQEVLTSRIITHLSSPPQSRRCQAATALDPIAKDKRHHGYHRVVEEIALVGKAAKPDATASARQPKVIQSLETNKLLILAQAASYIKLREQRAANAQNRISAPPESIVCEVFARSPQPECPAYQRTQPRFHSETSNGVTAATDGGTCGAGPPVHAAGQRDGHPSGTNAFQPSKDSKGNQKRRRQRSFLL